MTKATASTKTFDKTTDALSIMQACRRQLADLFIALGPDHAEYARTRQAWEDVDAAICAFLGIPSR